MPLEKLFYMNLEQNINLWSSKWQKEKIRNFYFYFYNSIIVEYGIFELQNFWRENMQMWLNKMDPITRDFFFLIGHVDFCNIMSLRIYIKLLIEVEGSSIRVTLPPFYGFYHVLLRGGQKTVDLDPPDQFSQPAHSPARPWVYIRTDTDTDILNIQITDG